MIVIYKPYNRVSAVALYPDIVDMSRGFSLGEQDIPVHYLA